MDLVLKVVVKTSSGRPEMFWACILFEVKPWDHLLPDEIKGWELGGSSPPSVPIWLHDLGRSHPLSRPQCPQQPNGNQISL